MTPSARGDSEPSELVAADLAADYFGARPTSVERFATGMAHWVYDIRGPAGEELVIRIGSPDQTLDFDGAVQWSGLLRPLGVPLPQLRRSGTWFEFPYLVLERLAGCDLLLAYDSVSRQQKQVLATEMVRIQRLLEPLGEGDGYGFVRLPGTPGQPSWQHVIDTLIARSKARIEEVRQVDPEHVTRVSEAARRLDGYFARVRPQPFLDDTTTKNVLVHEGTLTGIVDVDWICFGDPLLTVALTRASLLSAERDEDYTEYWCQLLEVTPTQQAAVQFYTALFCLDFMSELGHRFNRETPTVAPEHIAKLEQLLGEQLRGL